MFSKVGSRPGFFLRSVPVFSKVGSGFFKVQIRVQYFLEGRIRVRVKSTRIRNPKGSKKLLISQHNNYDNFYDIFSDSSTAPIAGHYDPHLWPLRLPSLATTAPFSGLYGSNRWSLRPPLWSLRPPSLASTAPLWPLRPHSLASTAPLSGLYGPNRWPLRTTYLRKRKGRLPKSHLHSKYINIFFL